MKNLKNMYLMNLKASTFNVRVIFSIFFVFMLINAINVYNGNSSSSELNTIYLLGVIFQFISLRRLPYDRKILSTIPLEKINLYPIAYTLFTVTLFLIYTAVFAICGYITAETIEINLILILAILVLIYSIFKLFKKFNIFSMSIGIVIFYYLKNTNFILNEKYLVMGICLILIFIILLCFIDINYLNVKNKKSKFKNNFKFSIFKNSETKVKNINDAINLNSYTSELKYILICSVLCIFIKPRLFTFIVSMVIMLDNPINSMALLGLPITKQKIYITKLVNRMYFVVSILAIGFVLSYFNLFNIDIKYMILTLTGTLYFMMFYERSYTVFRLKRPFWLVPLIIIIYYFLLMLLININIDRLLIINGGNLLLLTIIIFFKYKLLKKEMVDMNLYSN
ncbi:hypothetical protein [Peptoniphilus indolicus]|uniref:Uncharacterized protein n=1 Tax=Peptoniphilus indolicus TaxID=33030 RepID=A0A379DEI6_9FIRM|nr:hypothetical protein [Peptoniphilus indolicus]SUB76327.1 Uncharacterised protein [Peptoniphilus indolicus]